MNKIGGLSLACAYMSYGFMLIASASDYINISQSLKDGETLVSTAAKFELGFFSPGSSKNRYLGIWYKNIPVQTVVWVANRENPIEDSSGTLRINASGSVVLSSGTKNMVWSANPIKATQSPLLQILDSGNLVLRDTNSDSDDYLWQSFDYPSDTSLPGMKLGWDLRTSLNRRLTSWKSPDDPSPGEVAVQMELDPYPQLVLYVGPVKYLRGGPWNGLRFSGAPYLKKENSTYSFDFILNEDEVYYIYNLKSESMITGVFVNQATSTSDRYVWVESQKSWRIFNSIPTDYCDTYGLCGANGLCKINGSPMCQCLEGFKPRLSQSWDAMDWSGGCIRDKPLNCSERHDFIKLSGLKLPDKPRSWVNKSMSLRQCREVCLKSCSCTAYTNSDIRGRGSGCALWFNDLLDIRELADGGQDLYIRMPSSNQEKRYLVIIAAVITPTALLCGLVLIIHHIYIQKIKPKGETDETHQDYLLNTDDLDLPLYDLATITLAADDFSEINKLGEGGFGPVYKGSLNDGQCIAVKRLSKSSEQGLEEFKNEVKLIAKLQHRNLVKLIGCCIEGDEKILIYEYMPNGSLSSFLFDKRRNSELSWAKRFSIICGVARGVLYLHQDSRLRIVHRDLKASNVLLDDDLSPKISDFGTARIFGGDQIEENTNRIVGTYGYMPPEYAFYGLFSLKSDVFSFGVLLMEIVSGKKNRVSEDNLQNLIGYAWKLWTEGKPLDMIEEPKLNDIFPEIATRCIHVGLLCVQENPEDRPSMSSVVLMLNGESVLPQPKQPGFSINFVPRPSLSNRKESRSINDYSITTLGGP